MKLSSVDERLSRIEQQLTHPLSPIEEKQLVQELHDVQQKIKDWSTDQFSTAYLEGADERAIQLYGRIDTLAFDYEVQQIVEEAAQLERSMGSSDLKEVANRVNALKGHIQQIEENHLPLKKDKMVINRAWNSVEKALAFLDDRPAQIKNIEYEDLSDADRMALYEVFDLFRHDHKAARRAFHEKVPATLREEILHLCADKGQPDVMILMEVLYTLIHGRAPTAEMMAKELSELAKLQRLSSPIWA